MLALKSPTYRYFMIKKSLKSKTSKSHTWAPLKVPKREIFVTELFTRSDPIWIGDMRTEPIKPFV